MIYIDMDGVVANFDKRFNEIYGVSVENLDRERYNKFWNADCTRGFFSGLEAIVEGVEMVDELESRGIAHCFLTSTGGGVHHYNIAQQKTEFLSRHFYKPKQMAFCTGTMSKASFAHKHALLIDDRQKVVNAFVEGGGSAVLFTPESYEDIVNIATAFDAIGDGV